MQDSSYRGRR